MPGKESSRLFIGTLYSQENEFSDCVRSINDQTYKQFDHFVFSDLPNKEAHITLFKAFVQQAETYDLLIKVDADMVISNPRLFENIVRKMHENPGIDILTIAVHDFFSDQLIYGLNTYRNTVRWNLDKENLFVDIPDTPQDKYLFDDRELAPAAVHCPNPSPYQAFHYGVHRGLKMVQPDQAEKRESSRRTKWTGMEKSWQHYLRTKDIRLGLACLGAELAFSGMFTIQDLDITNPRLHNLLEGFLNMDPDSLVKVIRRSRLYNFGFLPSHRRRQMIGALADKRIKNRLLETLLPV